MTKPQNPGQGHGNDDNEGEDDDDTSVVVVVTDVNEYRYEGTSKIAVNSDGSLLVGKSPLAAFAANTWTRAYVEELPPPV